MTDRAFKVKNTLELGEYNTTIADTAVDVFVYDTSRDSDGGAWRHHTQHTSWYNETLNTATRGSRREFPAVAVIVAESDTVTIYDGDDPSLPMWMVFNGFTTNMLRGQFSSVSGLNGEIVVSSSTWPAQRVSLLKDNRLLNYTSGLFLYNGTVAQRNAGLNHAALQGTSASSVVSFVGNDVAMTVLPNAPIDAATGLPVPTIAVATDGGVSVIKNDGTVADSSETAGMAFVSFNESNRLFYNDDSSDQVYYADTYAADGFSDGHYDTDAAPYTLPGNVTDLAPNAFGQADGLTLLVEDPDTQASGMVACVTSSYNTGFMNGDVKGAFLSDTDDTDLVGSGQLNTNSGNELSEDWVLNDGWSIVSGELVRTAGSSGANRAAPRELTDLPISFGQSFYVEYEILEVAGTLRFEGSRIFPEVVSGSQSAVGKVVVKVTCINTSGGWGSTGFYMIFGQSSKATNIKWWRVAEEDRSVNGNGLAVYGTITKDPVATGADLVAYSGFSAANYLEQPYNSDLDFGTGDFCVMGWVNGAGQQALLHRAQPSSSGGFLIEVSSANALSVYLSPNTSWGLRLSTGAVPTNTWSFITVTRSSGVLSSYINGNLAATDGGSFSATSFPNNGDEVLRIGLRNSDAWPADSMALWRISATAPTAEQIAKIYEDEKVLFQENAQATLYGSSDAVTALAHDEVTDLLHVGTSAGRSVFQGLRRIENTTNAVGTAISAYDGLVVEE